VAAQIALALVVLVGAGLLGRTFQNLRSVDLGFESRSQLTFFVNLPQTRYADGDAIRPMLRELEERLAALPGVRSVGTVNSLPLSGFDGDSSFFVDGTTLPPPGQGSAAWIRRITAGYPETMGLRLINGRFIDERDASDGALVAVVNETLAERHFPGENPIGRRLDFGQPGGNLWEIVGVVADIRNFSVRDDRREAVYMAFDQVPTSAAFVVLRAEDGRDPALLAPDARRVLADIDPALAAQRVGPMADVVAGALAPDRFLAVLLGAFAAVTLLLAVVGLYGVMSVAVAARRRELGVRMALGAEGASIRGLVVGRALQLASVGLLLGLLLAVPGASVLRSMLFGVGSGDPLTFVAVSSLLLVVAVAAAAVPAWRAGRCDPARILRAE
jgi:putative ABC transport system permease protein